MEINWNDNVLNEFARNAGEQVAAALQSAIDAVGKQYRGRPVDEIKPALAAAWNGVAGGEITDPKLTDLAEHIRDGQPIVIQAGEPEA